MGSGDAAVLDALVAMLAERVAEKLATRPGCAPRAVLATSKNNPLGTARAFLGAARAGHFKSGRRGREVVAQWSDVEAYDVARVRPRPVHGGAEDRDRVTILCQRGVIPA